MRYLIEKHYRGAYEELFGSLPLLSHLPPDAGPVPDPEARTAWSDMTPEDRAAVTTVFVNMGKAIAAFERTLVPEPTRFDAWVTAQDFPAPVILSAQEIAEFRLYIGTAGCIHCHNGPLFTNHTFHNTNGLGF